MPALSKFLIALMMVFAGLALIAAVISKIASALSLTGLWQLFDQMQMFFVLILARSYLSADVLSVIRWQKFALDLPGIFEFTNIKFIANNFDDFYYPLSSSFLSLAEIKSDSVIYNTSSFIIVTMFLTFIFGCVTSYLVIFSSESTGEGGFSKLANSIKKVVQKTYEVMTFALLIRIMLVMALFLLLCSMNDVGHVNSSNSSRIFSLLVALMIITVYIALGIIMTILTFTNYEVIESEHNKLAELFSDLKMQRKPMLFSTLSISRKFVFALCIIGLAQASSRLLVAFLIVIQVPYLLYAAIVRPYSSVYLNIIEIMNQAFFFVLLGVIGFINKESESGADKSKFIMCLIAGSLIMASLVIISKSKCSSL